MQTFSGVVAGNVADLMPGPQWPRAFFAPFCNTVATMQSALVSMSPCTAHSKQTTMHQPQLCTFTGMRKASVSAHFGAAAMPLSVRRSASSRRSMTIEARAGARKVALLGAAGGIGQPLALLLKMQPYVAELSLYDIANTVGVAADLRDAWETILYQYEVDMTWR